jgi:tRNA-specific 2-thiouridylase
MADLQADRVELGDLTWVSGEPPPADTLVEAQSSAHGRPAAATFDGRSTVTFVEPQRRVAPGQSVVLYEGDRVLGGGIAR